MSKNFFIIAIIFVWRIDTEISKASNWYYQGNWYMYVSIPNFIIKEYNGNKLNIPYSKGFCSFIVWRIAELKVVDKKVLQMNRCRPYGL